MSDEQTSGFTAAEEAYFSSGGESGLPEESGADTGTTTETAETTTTDTSADTGADKGEGKAAPGDKTPPDRLLAAVHEERGKRKAMEKELREAQQKLSNFEGRFSVLDKLAPKTPGAEDKPAGPPSPEEDIFGAVKHVGETVAQVQKRLDDQAAATKATEEQTEFRNRYVADANVFEQTNKDYRPAYNFLLQTRAAELVAIGYDDPATLQAAGASPQEVQAAAKALHDALIADEAGIAQLAFSKNKSPAEIIYGLAKQRGYKAAAAKSADAKPAAEEQLERIERGQASNKSLSDVGGSGGDADMTAERLIAMPMDEYESWVAKNPVKARRLMGG